MDGKVVLITGANTGIGGALRLSKRLREFRHVDSDYYHCNIHVQDHRKKDKPWMLILQALKPPKTFIKEELRFIYSAGSNMVNAKDCLLSGQEQACSRITRLLGVLSSPCKKSINTEENGC